VEQVRLGSLEMVVPQPLEMVVLEWNPRLAVRQLSMLAVVVVEGIPPLVGQLMAQVGTVVVVAEQVVLPALEAMERILKAAVVVEVLKLQTVAQAVQAWSSLKSRQM
jgi:hypothetical protein